MGYWIIIYYYNNPQYMKGSITGWWFLATPLKNMSPSIGMMRFPTEWENKQKMATIHHQPAITPHNKDSLFASHYYHNHCQNDCIPSL